MDKLLQNLAATAEIMGAELSPQALAIMAKDLMQYEQNIIFQALSNLRKSKERFSLGSLIAEIDLLNPNRRIGADEAWSLYPHDEYATAAITNEIAEAMQAAQPLLNEGDKIGARMAFKDAYNRIVQKNKSENLEPKWFISLGTDKSMRETAIKNAIALGRVKESDCQNLLLSNYPEILIETINNMALLSKKELTQEDKQRGKEKLKQIRDMLLQDKLKWLTGKKYYWI